MPTPRSACACCQPPLLLPSLDRRRFLGLAAAGAAGLALAPRGAAAQTPKPYTAMLLSCVDPRTQAPVASWMNQPVEHSHATSLLGRYSQFTIAGAAVGVIAPAFPKAWGETFWENFSASIELHTIKNLLVVDHANCGALGIAYGKDVLDDPKLELQAHMAVLTEFKRQLSIRHPTVGFQAWYVARDAAGRFTEWKNLIAGPIIG